MFTSGKLKPELAEKRAEIEKLTQILDRIEEIVMLCDAGPEHNVVYMNRAAREAMHRHHDALQQATGADVDGAMDHSIHVYHKNPE
ncbi:MAG: methyl-accepting chemotaxis protein, partial [Burkholderiales bacterium]|nr:methyl-accepting chemotaxis protein [Burkholderiales bacterium]